MEQPLRAEQLLRGNEKTRTESAVEMIGDRNSCLNAAAEE